MWKPPKPKPWSAEQLAETIRSGANLCDCELCAKDFGSWYGTKVPGVSKQYIGALLRYSLGRVEASLIPDFFPQTQSLVMRPDVQLGLRLNMMHEALDTLSAMRSQPGMLRAKDMRVGYLYRGMAILPGGAFVDDCLVYVAPKMNLSVRVLVFTDEKTTAATGIRPPQDVVFFPGKVALASGRVVVKERSGKLITKVSELPKLIRVLASSGKDVPGLVCAEDLRGGSGFSTRLLGAYNTGPAARFDAAWRGEWPEGMEAGGDVGLKAAIQPEPLDADYDYEEEEDVPIAPAPIFPPDVIKELKAYRTKRASKKKLKPPPEVGTRLSELSNHKLRNVLPFGRDSSGAITPIFAFEDTYREISGVRFRNNRLEVSKDTYDVAGLGKCYSVRHFPSRRSIGATVPDYSSCQTPHGLSQLEGVQFHLLVPVKLFEAEAKHIWNWLTAIEFSHHSASIVKAGITAEDVAGVLKMRRHSVEANLPHLPRGLLHYTYLKEEHISLFTSGVPEEESGMVGCAVVGAAPEEGLEAQKLSAEFCNGVPVLCLFPFRRSVVTTGEEFKGVWPKALKVF